MKRRGAQAHQEGDETVHSDGWRWRGESNKKGSASEGQAGGSGAPDVVQGVSTSAVPVPGGRGIGLLCT